MVLFIRLSFAFFAILSTVLGFSRKSLHSGNKLRWRSSFGLHLAKSSLIIWDCDGVLVDSEALLKQGEVEALAKAGIDVTVDDCVKLFSGFSPDGAAENFLKVMKKPLPENFIRDQIAGSLDLFRNRLEPLMQDTVLALHDLNAVMCVASGSPRDRVEICVEVAKLTAPFPPERIFTRELVKNGKPAPDLFLYAAEKMGYKPEDCVVIEDSTSGVKAAQAAGMHVLGYLGGGHAKYDWYQEAIKSYNIPIFYTQEEVLQALLKYTWKYTS
mmetsp:Transcript_24901/g.25120  ORF Transcript_24901/g.25120 Transcript_24901/m.25120 type:complete len:270 (+) Transcript_24901:62-871(+)